MGRVYSSEVDKAPQVDGASNSQIVGPYDEQRLSYGGRPSVSQGGDDVHYAILK